MEIVDLASNKYYYCVRPMVARARTTPSPPGVLFESPFVPDDLFHGISLCLVVRDGPEYFNVSWIGADEDSVDV